MIEPRQVSAHPRLVIGVSGGSASGKTAITQAAARTCTPLSVVVLIEDDYYTDRGSKAGFDASDFNFDHPCARDHALLARHLSTLKAGRTIERRIIRKSAIMNKIIFGVDFLKMCVISAKQ